MVEQVQQQFAGLMARRAFEPVRRHLTGSDADDRLAEGIGMVWEMALRKAQQGVRLDDALLVHAVRLRAIEIRRQFVKGGQPRRDALHRANYSDGRTEVFHIEEFEDEDGAWPREGDVGLQVAWLSAVTHDPSHAILSALDLESWLDGLDVRDRSLLAGRYAGLGLEELANREGCSVSSTFSRLRRLGRDLSGIAAVPVPKKTRGARLDGARRSRVGRAVVC
jgi:DNA-directed RNA polymerase specialized sigma24 family protein